MPTAPDSAVAKQNYRPAAAAEDATAAQSVLRRMESLQTIEPPGDRSIMHLFVGGVLEEFCSETDLRCAHWLCWLRATLDTDSFRLLRPPMQRGVP